MSKRTLNKRDFLRWLTANDACHQAMVWARRQKRARDIVEKCRRDDWLLWLLDLVEDAWADYERIEGPALIDYALVVRGAGRAAAFVKYKRIRDQAVRQALTWERVSAAVAAENGRTG